ncbi:MAG: hypothetical protein RR716_04160 [Christensenellaceae bacterium]
MASDGSVRAARGVLYVISCIAIVIVVIAIIFVSFNTAMNTTNINMVLKDAFAKRVQVVLVPKEDGSDQQMLSNLFTQKFLSSDEALNGNEYKDYKILNYYQRAEIDGGWVWPWQTSATVKVKETVVDIAGELKPELIAEKIDDNGNVIITGEDAVKIKPPAWKNAVYEVEMKKINDSWKINSIRFLDDVVLPSASPTQSEKVLEQPTAATTPTE